MPVEFHVSAAAVVVGAAVVAAAVAWARSQRSWSSLFKSQPTFSSAAEAAAFALHGAHASTKAALGKKALPVFHPAVVQAADDELDRLDASFKAQAVAMLETAAKEFSSLEARRASSFQESSEEDEQLLRELWSQAGLTGVFQRRSEQWSSLGFQGMDPATDLRGGGMLALEHFVYEARVDNALLRDMVRYNADRLAEGDMSWFLTAVVSIQFSTRLILGDVDFKPAHIQALLEDGAGVGRGLRRMHAALLRHFFEEWQSKRPSVMEYTQFIEPNVIDTFFADNWDPKQLA